MTCVVAVGFSEESTAGAAAERLSRTAPDFLPGGDAVAVLSRDLHGVIHVTTSHEPPAKGRLLGLFWHPLLVPICFGPLLGARPTGAWLDLERVVVRAGLVRGLREPVTEMLQPGTSVLLLAVDPGLPLWDVVAAVPGFAGTVASSTSSTRAQHHPRWAVHGPPPRPRPASLLPPASFHGRGRPRAAGVPSRSAHLPV